MTKLQTILAVTTLVTVNSFLPAAARTQAKSGQTIANEKEYQEQKHDLKTKKSQLKSDYLRLSNRRAKLSQRLDEINGKLAARNTNLSASDRRTIANKLVLDEVATTLKRVDLDLKILEVDRNLLDVDKKLFALESKWLNNNFNSGLNLPIQKVEKLPDLDEQKADLKTIATNKKKLLDDLEPVVIKYWGNRGKEITEEALELRSERLRLWATELKTHKAFLQLKQKDLQSSKKQNHKKERKKLLAEYFRLKGLRQNASRDLVILENKIYKQEKAMNGILSSIYRRSIFVNQVIKSRHYGRLLSPQTGQPIVSSDRPRVNQYRAGIVFDTLTNWGSRVAKVYEDTSASEIGLIEGDEIVYVDDQPVLGSKLGSEQTLKGAKDKNVAVTIFRKGKLFKTNLKLDYRESEKSHPDIVKQIKTAKKEKDTQKLADAYINELNYVNTYSKNSPAADSTTEDLETLLKENKQLGTNLKIKAYAACASHYLSRMQDCLNRARRSKETSKDTVDSADFLNKVDDSILKIISLAEQSEDLNLDAWLTMIDVTEQYRNQFDFGHIGSSENLRKLSDVVFLRGKKLSDENGLVIALKLVDLSEIYELSLKDSKEAIDVLLVAKGYFNKALPTEAKECSQLRNALSRNLVKQKDKNLSEAIETMVEELAVSEAIRNKCKKVFKAQEYDYVSSLEKLSRWYTENNKFDDALRVAQKIEKAHFKNPDIVSSTAYEHALVVIGKNYLKLGKPKKAIKYLTSVLDRLESLSKIDCILSLAKAYEASGKETESRIISFILKDYLRDQLFQSKSIEVDRKLGDMACEVAQLLNKTDNAQNAIPLYELAIKAYTDKLNGFDWDGKDEKKTKTVKPVVENLSKKMKEFSVILNKAGNHERADRVLKFSNDLNSKLASGESLDSDWLVQVP